MNRPSEKLARREALREELLAIEERAPKTPDSGRWWGDVLREINLSKIEALLAAEVAFVPFVENYARADGMGATGLTIRDLSSWIVLRIMAVGAEQTLADLERYVEQSVYPMRFALAVRGITVTGSHSIADGIEIRESSQDIAMFEPREAPPTSTAVFLLTAPFPKIVSPSAEGTAYGRGVPHQEEIFRRIELARLCVALMIDSRVVETLRTATPVASVPGSASRGSSKAEHVPPVKVHALNDADLGRIRRLHGRVTSLDAAVRDRLSIAMAKWHASLGHFGVSPELFIDVGIGLECVFLPEESSELKHRLAVRGARLLGGRTLESRKQFYAIFEALYDARSQAVHRGRLLRRVKPAAAHDIVHLAAIGRHVLRNAILAMVDRGRDEWEEIVLG